MVLSLNKHYINERILSQYFHTLKVLLPSYFDTLSYNTFKDFQMRCLSSLQLKGVQNCQRSKFEKKMPWPRFELGISHCILLYLIPYEEDASEFLIFWSIFISKSGITNRNGQFFVLSRYWDLIQSSKNGLNRLWCLAGYLKRTEVI